MQEWKLQHPEKSAQRLKASLTNGNIPSIFEMRACFECNNRCIHCFNEDIKRTYKALALEELFKYVDKLTTEEMVVVTGGEPTMRKDLLDLLKYIKEKGKLVHLHTNGVRLSDKKYLERLIPFIDLLTLPIHSSNYDIFDSITRVKGSANKTVKAFRNLVQIDKITIVTQTVINQLNYKTLLDTFDMIQDISPGIRMILTFPHPKSSAFSKSVVPMFSEIKEYVCEVLKKYSNLILTHYIPKCVLHPYQDVAFYFDKIDEPDVLKPGVDYIENWRKVNFETFISRIKTDICKTCKFDDVCVGVWKEYGELYPEPDLVPITE
jgi:MoaA/NifB/PqqE/SkfB family radical SAM enzyme